MGRCGVMKNQNIRNMQDIKKQLYVMLQIHQNLGSGMMKIDTRADIMDDDAGTQAKAGGEKPAYLLAEER